MVNDKFITNIGESQFIKNSHELMVMYILLVVTCFVYESKYASQYIKSEVFFEPLMRIKLITS